MIDKEKMVEEIEKILQLEQIKIANTTEEFAKLQKDGINRCNAEALHNAGCRVVHEGEVVLTKEEYERLKKEELYAQGKYNLCHGNRSLEAIAKTTEQTGQILIDYDRRIRKAYDEIIPKLLEENKQVRKETAREIIKDLIRHRFAHYEVDEKHGTYRLLSDYVVDKEDVKFFEDKYGVEVEE